MKDKIGICIWSVPEKDDESRIRLAHKLGIRGIEVDLGLVADKCPLSQPEVQKQYKEWRDELGLTYTALGLNELCFTAMTHHDNHQRLFPIFDKAIEVAVEMQIPLLQLPSFGASEINNAEEFGSTVTCLRYICEKAKDTNVLIGSENALDLANQKILLDMIDAPNFRIYFDTANPKCMKGLDGPELLEDAIDRVAEVHLKDGFQDDRPALIGEGESNVAGSLDILKKNGYDGWLHLENNYHQLPKHTGLSSEELIAKDIKIVQNLLADE